MSSPPPLDRLPAPSVSAPGGDPLAHVLAAEARFDALLQEAAGAAESTIARAHQRVAELEDAAPAALARDVAALEAAAQAERAAAVARLAEELREQAARFDAWDDAACDRLGEWALRRAAGIDAALPDVRGRSGAP